MRNREGHRRRHAELAVKRAGDIVGSAVLMVLMSPVMAGCSLAIRITDGPPVFFRQVRPGKDGALFTMTKFRTMRAPRDNEDLLTTDSVRVTRIGSLLRRTSLDELPELLNVLRGQMSLVGPRPLLPEYLDKYSEHHRRRHAMRPGVTGLAQVSGRRSITLGQRLDLDIVYIDNWSLWLDCKILLRTVLEPFREGANDAQQLEEVDDVGFFS